MCVALGVVEEMIDKQLDFIWGMVNNGHLPDEQLILTKKQTRFLLMLLKACEKNTSGLKRKLVELDAGLTVLCE